MAIDPTIQSSAPALPPPAPAVSAAAVPTSSGGFSFRTLLSDLNPFHTAVASGASGIPGQQVTGTSAAPASGGAFRTLLSDINPLQYIPVVGAVYRAVTGDEGNADLRFVASLGTSFALGGPVGVGITVAEKVTGIDPETIGRRLLSRLLHPAARPTSAPAAALAATPALAATASTATTVKAAALASDITAGSAARAWTPDELSAYGVKRTADNGLAAGGLSSADVLNTLELHRLSSRLA